MQKQKINQAALVTASDDVDSFDGVDSFDSFLAAQLADTNDYIPDAGFSAGVMAQLTAKPALNPWLRWGILLLPLVLTSTLVLGQFPWRKLVQQAYGFLLQLDFTGFLQLGIGLAAAVCCWVIYLCRRDFSL